MNQMKQTISAKYRRLAGLSLVLLLTLVCAAALADVTIDETHFPDNNFRKYVLTLDDGDGELTDQELQSVRTINVRLKGIRQLDGIEYFNALTELNCGDNLLTELDVGTNSSLTVLNCEANHLTALDVSKNTELTLLSCSNNQLTSLNVNNGNALKTIECYNNKLESFDVINNTALTTLDCHKNQLAALDVSKNTALTQLSCDGNKLNSLDVSNHTALTKLTCENNLLTSINISNNTALSVLWCSNNQLATLDVSGCPILDRLVIDTEPQDHSGTILEWSDSNGNVFYADKDVTIITSATGAETPSVTAVSKITLSKAKATMTRTGKQPKPTLNLSPTVLPTDATDKSVTWTSDKPKIATVDKNGKVTALKAGTATITSTANDGSGKSAKCVITVKDAKVTKITLSKTKATLKVGKTLQLKVKKFTPASPLNTKVKWTTSNKKIATVDKNGKVKAKKAGKVTITCTSVDNKKVKAKCTITVK